MVRLVRGMNIGLILFSIFFSFLIINSAPAFASTHISSAQLEPEWSPVGEVVDYKVNITNKGPDTVDEVRIYLNPNYEDFHCEEKSGWGLIYNPNATQPYCFYFELPGGDTIPAGESDVFEFSAKTMVDPEDICNLKWKFETRDVNEAWRFIYDTTGIDSLPPKITKGIDGPSVGSCPPEAGEECWVADNSTEIIVHVSDFYGLDCRSGIDYCRYRINIDGEEGTWQDAGITPGDIEATFSVIFTEDSVHELEVECSDLAKNTANDTETFRVDSTPPETEKVFDGPQKIVGGVEWVSTGTNITLSATDPDPTGFGCNIGVNKTLYVNTVTGDERACSDPENYCKPIIDPPSCDLKLGKWQIYTGSFINENESCHILQYYSKDSLSNKEEMHVNCYYVDDTPPLSEKTHGTPLVEDTGFDWVTQDTTITIDCLDQEPHPVAQETLCYKVTLEDDSPVDLTAGYCSEYGGSPNAEGYCCLYVGDESGEQKLELNFMEDSNHTLEYYCVDHLGNDERDLNSGLPNMQRYKVDSVAPEIEKQMVGSYSGDCPPDDETDQCYVAADGNSGINVTVGDGGEICAVDRVECEYLVYWYNNGDSGIVSSGTFEENIFIEFKEDSRHELYIHCMDALGNYVEDTETFYVDAKPPVTKKTYGTPFYKGMDSDWITSATEITLNATDEKIGVNKTYWRNLLLSEAGEKACSDMDEFCNPEYYDSYIESATSWTEYDGPFTKPEESCHVIEYYSTDLLGNIETTKYQCVYVDNSDPELNKTVGDPKIACDSGEACDYYISRYTPVTLTCADSEPHPVGHVTLVYRYRYSDDCSTWGSWGAWYNYTGSPAETVLYFPEDSCHEIEYACEDALGNAVSTVSEIDIVDTVAPEIEKTIIGPMYGDCPPDDEGDICYIDNVTEIGVDATDPDPHPVGRITCDWTYTVRETKKTGGMTNVSVPFTIQFPEESTHDLTITCRDGLGNEATDSETFYVDHTAPLTTKTYSGPYFQNNESSPEWISSLTQINLSVQDLGPHKSGIKETLYRVTLVDDSYCASQSACLEATGSGIWEEYVVPFNIDEDSCHLIEYYSTDNVDKSESVNRQCAYVDNQAPEPQKAVGDPKTEWDGADSTYYPGIKDLCWNGASDQIECWKITLLTPITLDCVDPDPHPVGYETLCYKVDFDGDDITGKYCQGTVNDDGWCCGEPSGTVFYFGEESEHNLEYYCTDALNNSGDIDEEKFKVEGSTFNITINKKWNLISVPFVMLEDSIGEVFEGIADNIDAVWSYDTGTDTWSVYTPGPAPDTLGEMVPGNGYWVKATNSTVLKIGGSLFSPAVTPPDKPIVPGWNLIGYWGTEGLDSYNGPFGNGQTTECELYSLGENLLDKEFASLWTYWEPDNPNQWIPLDMIDRMDPGAGYWLYTAQSGLYVAPTACLMP